MSEDYIQVDNSTEYNKNGSVKAFQSLIHHTQLNKTVKVRHKDHIIYSQRFEQAIEQLSNEWEVTKTNQEIKSFIFKASRLHVSAYDDKPFVYKQFALDRVRVEKEKAPSEPKYSELPVVPPEPLSEDKRYKFEPKWYHKLFNLVEKKQLSLEKLYARDLKNYNEKLELYNNTVHQNEVKEKNYKKAREDYINNFKMLKDQYNSLLSKYRDAESKESVMNYFKLTIDDAMKFHNLYDEIKFEIDFDLEDKVGIIDFRFPSEDVFPKVKEYKFIKTKNEIKETYFKDKELNALIKDAYYSLYIAIALEIFRLDTENIITNLVLNGYYKGIDKRKGKEFEVCIMTSKIDSREFQEINFDKIVPRDTFKYFSGKGTPDPDNISKVEPIRFTDKTKFRLIDSDSVLSNLSADTNLAAMDWKEFETLIRDVFELEFSEQDIEIRNTQHSNDGGIDVVAFNKNPYTGGVILLQAKRYTNIVTPEPVRALKGSMEEHKAIRGILVTTSNFGGSSREFAGQHNITLINGDQLIDLLQKHGYDFHIDLGQAKIINSR